MKPASSWMILAAAVLLCAPGNLHAAKAKPLVDSPDVTAAVNGVAVTKLCRGWPLILEVSLLHRHSLDLKVKALSLAAATGPWSNLLQIHVTNDQDQNQTWPFQLANTPGTSIKLSNKLKGRLFWYVSAADTAQIPVGNYSLEVLLDTTSSRSKWQGTTRSPDVSIELTDEPATLSPEQEETKYMLFARFAFLSGDNQQALTHVETLLSKQPGNIAALTLRTALLELDGDLTGALADCNQALESVFAQDPNPQEPPQDLLIKRRQLQDKLLGLK